MHHPYLEPDENWKQQTRKEIERELWPLVEEARARCTHLSQYSPDSVAMRVMTKQYEQTMTYICNMAETTYRERLARERESRKSSPYAYMNEHDLTQYLRETRNVLDAMLATPRFAERVSSSVTSPEQAQEAAITASVNHAHPILSEDSESMSGKQDERAPAARFPPQTTCTTDTESESSNYGPNTTPVSETRTVPEMWREKGSGDRPDLFGVRADSLTTSAAPLTTDSVTWIWSPRGKAKPTARQEVREATPSINSGNHDGRVPDLSTSGRRGKETVPESELRKDGIPGVSGPSHFRTMSPHEIWHPPGSSRDGRPVSNPFPPGLRVQALLVPIISSDCDEDPRRDPPRLDVHPTESTNIEERVSREVGELWSELILPALPLGSGETLTPIPGWHRDPVAFATNIRSAPPRERGQAVDDDPADLYKWRLLSTMRGPHRDQRSWAYHTIGESRKRSTQVEANVSRADIDGEGSSQDVGMRRSRNVPGVPEDVSSTTSANLGSTIDFEGEQGRRVRLDEKASHRLRQELGGKADRGAYREVEEVLDMKTDAEQMEDLMDKQRELRVKVKRLKGEKLTLLSREQAIRAAQTIGDGETKFRISAKIIDRVSEIKGNSGQARYLVGLLDSNLLVSGPNGSPGRGGVKRNEGRSNPVSSQMQMQNGLRWHFNQSEI